MRVSRSKYEIHVHLVWWTMRGQPMLDGGRLMIALRSVTEHAGELGCDVIAVGGVEDHIHALIKLPGTLSVSGLVKQIKGASSHCLNLADRAAPLSRARFRWQHGFGAFSISRSHIPKVADYIRNQEAHHASGNLYPNLEESEDD